MKPRVTSHSEYGAIQRVLIHSIENAFRSSEKIEQEWSSLNFLAAPDLEKAKDEFEHFKDLLAAHCKQVDELPQNPALTLDSLYCRDSSIITDHGLILCNMGKESRKQEPSFIQRYALASGIPVLGIIQDPGTIEGGDTAWLDERTLIVAHSYRTNKSGIEQLKILLSPYGISVMEVDLPHYKGPQDVFHLMSIFSPIDRDVAVVYSPLMSIRFRNELVNRAFHLIEVPDEEFETMGCNVLAVKPRGCIMMEGNPITQSRMIQAGCQVITYAGQEISFKGGGGPTCLTRPLQRLLYDTGFG